MMTMRLAFPALCLALILARGAQAQSIDYGAMEALFREPVTTSVTGMPQRVTDAPANIEIVTQDDIRRSGATNVPDVLRMLAGVDVRANSLAGRDVGIRGYNQTMNPRLMVMINGQQVYAVEYNRVLWAALPVQLDEIRQIEVIKGPNSALYGFNAVGGAINIITYDPLKDDLNVATARGGTQSYTAGSVVGTARIGDAFGIRLSAGGFRSRDFAPGAIAPYEAEGRRPPFNGTLAADARWQISPEVRAYFNASYADTRVSQPSPEGIFFTEQARGNSFRAGLDADTPIGIVSVAAYRNEAYSGSFVQSDFGRSAPFAQRQIVTVLQMADLVKLGAAHTVRASFEFRDNSDATAGVNGRLTDRILAAGLMWNWRLSPSLIITNAARVDYVQLNYAGTPSPGLGFTVDEINAIRLVVPSTNNGLVWSATDMDTFRFSVARGVQLPSLLSQGYQVDPTDTTPIAYYGKPNLRPAITWNAEIDYDRAIPAIESVLRTAIFVQRTDDVIANAFSGNVTFLPTGNPAVTTANVGYSTAAGLEIGLKGHNAAGWRWNISYALAATTDHTSLNQGPFATSTISYTHSAPNHVVTLGLGYSQGRWEADLMARWQAAFVDFRTDNGPTAALIDPVNINNYITLNARVGFRVTDNVTVSAVARQLNTGRLVTTAATPTERELLAAVTVRF